MALFLLFLFFVCINGKFLNGIYLFIFVENLMKKRREIRCEALRSILSVFPNMFNKFSNTWSQMQDSVFHMTLKSHFIRDFHTRTLRVSHNFTLPILSPPSTLHPTPVYSIPLNSTPPHLPHPTTTTPTPPTTLSPHPPWPAFQPHSTHTSHPLTLAQPRASEVPT